MGIVDEDVVSVRRASDIVEVISGYTQLKKVGSRWTGLCPFHQEKSPSFSVNAEEGLYYCFGCRASGDVITFVRAQEHTDFVGAVERLAERTGITLRYTEAVQGESRKRAARLHDLMDAAVDWYHHRLKDGPDAATARGYLRSRGFDSDQVTQFRVGWAPDPWDEMCRAMKAPQQDLIDCGLGFVNKANRMQDFFRSRILFPILDDQGRAVAFGGRKLPDADGPKYQNSRENVLYNKSRTLYALNWAKADIVRHDQAVICEGYTDVIGFHRAGIPRAVATCGTALTEDHLRQLKRFTNRVVLAYDADEAGQTAAERMYAWEAALELAVSVLRLPAGTDPDELARTDPEALAAAVADAPPFLKFRVDRVLLSADLTNPEGRARAASAALNAVGEHPDPLVRDQYLMEVADVCRIDPERLRERLLRGGDRSADRQVPNQPSETDGLERIRDDVDTEALRLMLSGRFPRGLALHPRMLRDGPVRRAYVALQHADGDVRQAISDGEPIVADLLARLSVDDSTAEPDDVLTRLAQAAGLRRLRGIEAEARRSDNPLEFGPLLSWLKLRLDALGGDEPEMDVRDDLLAWLEEEAEVVA